jgi:carboxylesterase type B
MGKLQGGEEMGEDCLFLDVYVPGKALKGNVKLPIVNWLYGGMDVLDLSMGGDNQELTAFCLGSNLFGTKGGIYGGTGIINASGGNVIFVAGNYRVSLIRRFPPLLLAVWVLIITSSGRLVSSEARL